MPGLGVQLLLEPASGVIRMQKKSLVCVSSGLIFSLSVSLASADELSIPNTFSSGETISASSVNSNFDALESAVNDLISRVDALESASSPEFLGFSSAKTYGGDGIYEMQSACDASFSGSKVCTTVEYANAPYNPNAENLVENAWIFPEIIHVGDRFVSDKLRGYEVSTIQGDVTCNGYTSSGNGVFGTSVTPSGGVKRNECNTARPVACCK